MVGIADRSAVVESDGRVTSRDTVCGPVVRIGPCSVCGIVRPSASPVVNANVGFGCRVIDDLNSASHIAICTRDRSDGEITSNERLLGCQGDVACCVGKKRQRAHVRPERRDGIGKRRIIRCRVTDGHLRGSSQSAARRDTANKPHRTRGNDYVAASEVRADFNHATVSSSVDRHRASVGGGKRGRCRHSEIARNPRDVAFRICSNTNVACIRIRLTHHTERIALVAGIADESRSKACIRKRIECRAVEFHRSAITQQPHGDDLIFIDVAQRQAFKRGEDGVVAVC